MEKLNEHLYTPKELDENKILSLVQQWKERGRGRLRCYRIGRKILYAQKHLDSYFALCESSEVPRTEGANGGLSQILAAMPALANGSQWAQIKGKRVYRGKMLVADEVAELLRVSKQRIYELVRTRAIPVTRLGERQYRFEAEAINQWIERGGTSDENERQDSDKGVAEDMNTQELNGQGY